MAATSPTRRVTMSRPRLKPQPIKAPSPRPPTDIQVKSLAAFSQLNEPAVSVAATANFSATRPEASFSSDSPSSRCMVLLGMPRLREMAETATASVGETTAARAKATVSGMLGISQ